MLHVSEKVRGSVLEVEPLPGSEKDIYIGGTHTQPYKTYGAPKDWNSLYVASELESFILSNNIEALEQSHIKIFQACLEQEFFPQDIPDWLSIFQKLKRYFFIALVDKELCPTSIGILTKFYLEKEMQKFVIENTKEEFVNVLKLLFNPDNDRECQDRNKDFLESLHNREDGSPALKEFVYTIIKTFASKAPKAYETSNLIELMNGIVNERRGAIFSQEGGKAGKKAD